MARGSLDENKFHYSYRLLKYMAIDFTELLLTLSSCILATKHLK